MTELNRFKERHRTSRSTVLLAAVIGVTAGVVLSHTDLKSFIPKTHMVSAHQEKGLALATDPTGPKYDADHARSLEAATKAVQSDKKVTMEDAKALSDVASALRRMEATTDLDNPDYAKGDAGIAARERDFVAASNDYEKAAKKLERWKEAEVLADQNPGPGMGWKADDLAFSLDALEAVGGNVDAARNRGGFKP
ncbi:hypothetical protein [Rhizobium sp. BK176]|uniref:hypothetical protein n=1 Tax=Rhizobium sp. BK176 TaxID=2587071 RepID=UPI00216A40EA|nr:hypothetical protein [Rhizobium sp. BK176]MCS4089056.1 hypothetical protein [Rhizobium sp. BK176]